MQDLGNAGGASDAGSPENIADEPENNVNSEETSEIAVPVFAPAQPRNAAPPSDDRSLVADSEKVAAGNILPTILIAIGVIVGVVLLAAIVTTLLRSQLIPNPVRGVNLPPSPEQAPLNDVQAQRVGNMDW